MIRSMTGFGWAEGEHHGARVTAELRTVNHRHLDVSVRLPRFLSTLEVNVRRSIQGSLSRGKVSAAITWDGDADSAAGDVRIDLQAAARYIELLRALQKEFDLPGTIDVHAIASRPEVFTHDRAGVSEEEAWGALEPLLQRALHDLDTMRAREGHALAHDLGERLCVLDGSVEAIARRAPHRVVTARDLLRARVQELLGDITVDDARVAMEIAMLADRLDVTEECVRLRTHIVQFRELLATPESTGRKLTFLLQEMGREANTIGSKANDVEIVSNVLTIKEELERIREQVANVE